MDHASHETLVYIYENTLSSNDYHSTLSAASRWLISILWKHVFCTTRTFNIGSIAQRATWHIEPCFQRYTCLDTGNCTMFKRLSDPFKCCVQRAHSILCKLTVVTIRTANLGPISLKPTWYMDHASHDTLVYIYENTLSSSDYQTTLSAASRWLISISWKPVFCSTRTFNIGPIAQRATWYMDHASHDTLV